MIEILWWVLVSLACTAAYIVGSNWGQDKGYSEGYKLGYGDGWNACNKGLPNNHEEWENE